MNIDYPFQFDARGRSAGTTDADHVRDMIELLLLTNPGERVNRPDFGSGLLRAIFAPNSPEIAAAMEFSTRATLQRELGDLIEVQALAFTAQDSTLRVELVYVLKSTGERRQEIIAIDAPTA
jgi:phage baseplate assembly protein W